MLTIWSIDDDDDHRFIIEKTLVKGGFNSNKFFNNADSAISKLIELKGKDSSLVPDIVLVDIYMPVTDGWDFIASFNEMRNRFTKNVKVFLLTYSVLPEDIERAKSNHTTLLSKPFQLENLLKHI